MDLIDVIWEDVQTVVNSWIAHHHPADEEFLRTEIHTRVYEGQTLLLYHPCNVLGACNHLAKAVYLYNVLDRDGYLSVCDRVDQSKAYVLHAVSCIQAANMHGSGEICREFLERALSSIKKVHPTARCLRHVIEFKQASLLYAATRSAVWSDRMKAHREKLLAVSGDEELSLVMMAFNATTVAELRKKFDFSVPLKCISVEPKAESFATEWLPRHVQNVEKARKQIVSNHSKKQPKRSRRAGKSRPGPATPINAVNKIADSVKGSGHQRSPVLESAGGATAPVRRDSDQLCRDKSSTGEPRVLGRRTVGMQNGLSPSSERWLSEYRFRLACKTCFRKDKTKLGKLSYRLNKNLTHAKHCSKEFLICQLPSNEGTATYELIRPWHSNAREALCLDFISDKPCKGEDCPYPHSWKEQEIWKAEQKKEFDRPEIMNYLKAHPANSCHSTEPQKVHAVQGLMRKYRGSFLFLCQVCYDGTPQRISRPKASNLSCCSFKKEHCLKGNKLLVFRTNGCNRYTKIRRCPLNKKLPMCRFIQRTFGCDRGDACRFAHSQIEADVWLAEASCKIVRDDFVEISSAGGDLLNEQHSVPAAYPKLKTTRSTGATHDDRSHYRHFRNSTSDTTSTHPSPTDVYPFTHPITIACGLCFDSDQHAIREQDPERQSMCSGPTRHPWGQYTVYTVHSPSLGVWVRVRSRHPRLWPHIKLRVCDKGRQCKEREFGTPCRFPHCAEELALWEYQKEFKLSNLSEVVKIQRSHAKSPPTVPRAVIKNEPEFHCPYCNYSCTTKEGYEAHLRSDQHRAKILSDSDVVWKYRSPPHDVLNGGYQLCKENITGQCEFSSSSQEDNDCRCAHSQEELDEWRQRHDYLKMKLGKAKKLHLFHWLDELVLGIDSEDEDIIAEEIYGIEVECSREPHVTCVLNPRQEDIEGSDQKREIKWNFIIHSSEKRLKRVGLLYDQHRPQFFLSEPAKEFQPQTCPGLFLRHEDNPDDYHVKVIFTSSCHGLYKQWLVFDFGEKPFLVLKLSVHMGSAMDIEQHEQKRKEEEVNDLWTECNSTIVRYGTIDTWTQQLTKKYPEPESAVAISDGEDMLNVQRDSYKGLMHHMLLAEERSCMEIVSRYRTLTDMEISERVQLESLLIAQGGELFGTLQLHQPLHDDSEASQVFKEMVDNVLIQVNGHSDAVYEAHILKSDRSLDVTRNALTVLLSRTCVNACKLRGLLKGKSAAKVQITLQLAVNRHQFLIMHHAVDSVTCMDVVLPRPNQPDRFSSIGESDCPERLNKRQEKIVRCICSSGEDSGIQSHSGPTMILGPFGTGKTHTVAMAVKRILKQRRDVRILICTRSNSAADLYITDYLDQFCEEMNGLVQMMRIYHAQRKTSTVCQAVMKYCLLDAAGFRLPTEEEYQEWTRAVESKRETKSPNLVLATLTTAVHLTKMSTLRGYFTHIVIDEAGQVIENEAIIPLALATNRTCVTLAGDPKQMSPVVHSTQGMKAKFHLSLLQRLYKYDKQNSCKSTCLLTDNYRSCQPILDFLKVHYGTALRSMVPDSLHPNLHPLNFVSVRGRDKVSGESYVNADEVGEIVEKVDSLLHNWPEQQWGRPKQSEIVVLSPYKQQVNMIRHELRKKTLHAVTVETVQNVQGKQYRAVFISTVRTRATMNKINITAVPQSGRSNRSKHYWYGFLSDRGLLNTAFTRAKSLIVVMGDPVSLCSVGECQKTWERYIKCCEANRSIIPDCLTMNQIKKEVAAAKHILSPNARVFTPVSRDKSHRSQNSVQRNAGFRSMGSRAVAVQGCTQTPGGSGQSHYEKEFPLPDCSRPPIYDDDDDDDDDDELLNREEWLRDLKAQMQEDMLEYRRKHPPTQERSQEEAAAPLAHSEAAATSQIPGMRADRSAPPLALPIPAPVTCQSEEQILGDMHMVEKDGHVSILPKRQLYHERERDAYDSDDGNEESVDRQSRFTQEKSITSLLQKTMEMPEKFKICTFHQDINGRMFAVPSKRESGETVDITSWKRRGHALNGDLVVVEILEDNEVLETDNDVDKIIYGRVEGILESNADLKFKKFVCYLDPHSDNVMVPIDRTCPKMLMIGRDTKRKRKQKDVAVVTIRNITKKNVNNKNSQIVENVEVSYSERAHKLFVVRFLEWPQKTPYPLGGVVEELPPGETVESGLKILKLIYGVQNKCKKATREQVQRTYPTNWSIPEEDILSRRDLRGEKVFTIDPPGAEDLDDAISIKVLPGVRFQVDIHIADVSYFVAKDSPMDKEAQKRGTSFYHPFPGLPFPMLPVELSTKLCSLLPGEERLAVTVRVILDDEGRVVADPVFIRSVIKSMCKLTYEDAEGIISGNTPSACENIVEPIRTLHHLAKQRRTQRLKDGWMIYDANDDEEGAVSHPYAHSLIEEFMILANKSVAEKLLKDFPHCVPLRRQLAPSQDQMKDWKESHQRAISNSILLSLHAERSLSGSGEGEEKDLEGESAGSDMFVANEVWEQVCEQVCALVDNDYPMPSTMEKVKNLLLQDKNHPLQAIALSSYFHVMESAEYIDTTTPHDDQKQSHYSLKLRAYTHFTSPIRRYIDLVVHRMLIASLEGAECPYSARDIADITHHCNNQTTRKKHFTRDALSLKLALKVKHAPLQLTSFVEGFSDTSMRLLFPYRSYVQSQQRNVAFRSLMPAGKPDVEPNIVTLRWKNRIYDKMRKTLAVSPSKEKYPQQMVCIPGNRWHAILTSIMNGTDEDIINSIQTAGIHCSPNRNPFGESDSTMLEEEYVTYQRKYSRGDICQIQMNSQLVKGILTPALQLFNISSQQDFCIEHRSSPVTCFSSIAEETPGREKNVTIYKTKWLQVMSMVTAHSSVSNDDTVTLQNVKVSWQKKDGVIHGHFDLPEDFLEANHIYIAMAKDGTIRNDYHCMCIRVYNQRVSTSSRLSILGCEKRRTRNCGPFNGNDWIKQTIVIHCRLAMNMYPALPHPEKKKTSQRGCNESGNTEPMLLPVDFVVHQTSVPFPNTLLEKDAFCSVELIQLPEPDRRMKEAVSRVDQVPVLVRDIVLQRPNKANTDDVNLRNLLRGARELTDLSVPNTDLQPLNSSQQKAIKHALESTFSVIQGPPGTGKSVTGAYLAYFFSRLNSKLQTGDQRPHVLYCGPSNKSVDVVTRYLKRFRDVSIVRVYGETIEQKQFPIPGKLGFIGKWAKNEAEMAPDLHDVSLHHLIRQPGAKHGNVIRQWERSFRSRPKSVTPLNIKKYKSTLTLAMREELQKHDVVMCTCNAAGAFRIEKFTTVMQVIVDEAGMCSEPETLIPLVYNKPRQVVLIGDHKQLRSIVTEPHAQHLGMDISLLEKYESKARMLTIQYRMHEELCRFPSSAFYDDKLQTDNSVRRRGPDPLRKIWPNNGTTPRVFCHVSGKEETLSVKSAEGNEMSKSNKAEVSHVIRIVKEMIRIGAHPKDIVIMSQYRLQCSQLRDKLDGIGSLFKEIKVSTVVKSQGSEWDYVIFSTVRSKPTIEIEPKPSPSWKRRHLGFIADEHQMNVALTRARRGLIIVGNKNLLQTHDRWKELIVLYRTTGCMKNAQHFLPTHHH